MTAIGAITAVGMDQIRAHVLARIEAEVRADPSQANDAARSLVEFGVLSSELAGLRWIASLDLPPTS